MQYVTTSNRMRHRVMQFKDLWVLIQNEDKIIAEQPGYLHCLKVLGVAFKRAAKESLFLGKSLNMIRTRR